MKNGALIIFLKDMRDSLRNRRTLLRMLILPGLLLPFGGHYLLTFTDRHREDLNKVVLEYAVSGEQNLPDLVKLYESDSNFRRVNVPEEQFSAAVKDKRIRFALVIPKDAGPALKAGESVSVQFIYHQADPGELAVKDRGTAPLEAYSVKQRNWRLVFLGLTDEGKRASLLEPVTYAVVNTASDRERLGFGIGGSIAYLFMVFALMGASFAAIDLVAGEKEKGTLEILVMLPTPRWQIVLGKYLVVFTFGLVYATLSALSISALLTYEISSVAAVRNVITQIGPTEIFMLWTTLLPVTAFFSAVVLTVSVYARSYREGSSLVSFASVAGMMLSTVVFVPGINLTWAWSVVPISNLGLMIRELIRGRLTDYLVVMPIFATTLAVGFALILVSTALFRREAIIYRE